MCGFTGFFGEGDYNREKAIDDMSVAIAHRGPDSDGKFVEKDIALGFRRLSIIDLDGGHQPIYSPDGRYVIVFNGEIYNYRELREELSINHGHTFKTDSDTEVILHTYMQYKEDAASHLRGMFAFVIYDRENESLYGARDMFGIKPFYWSEIDGTYFFGSEIKSFLHHPSFKKEIAPEILSLYLQFQYSPIEQTIFKNVYKLLPGRYFTLTLKDGMNIKRYHTFDYAPVKRSEEEAADLIDKTVLSSVQYHKIADVEVGSFLSGGVDSSYIATVAHPDKTFSVGFDAEGFDETSLAQELCHEKGMKNRKKEITPDEFFEALPMVQYHSDEPHANLSAVPLYYLSALASEDVKVVLSGEGADELFGGYDEYTCSKKGMAYRKLPLPLRKAARKMFGGLGHGIGRFLKENASTPEEDYIGQANIMSSKTADSLLTDKYKTTVTAAEVTAPYYDAVKDRSELEKKMYLDMHLWLQGDILLKADKMTMAHSLELRVPFLDREVWKAARTLDDENKVRYRHSKAAFRAAAYRHIPSDWSNRRKRGFMVPFRLWIKEDKYYSIVKECFNREYVSEFFVREKLIKMLDDHKLGKANYGRIIYTVYSFLLWYEQYFILR